MTPIIRKYSICYLATPYSRWPTGIHNAFVAAATLTAKLLLNGVKVYSPIAHTHPIAMHGAINPIDHEIWLPFDQAMLEVAQALLVAQMPGWRDSRGTAYEIDFFERSHKPIHYLPEEFCNVGLT